MSEINEHTIVRLAGEAIRIYPYEDRRFPPSMYYRFLKLLTAEMQPRLSVELGLCGGGGSLYMSLGWPDGIVVGIDLTDDYPDNIQHIKDTCPNFEYWQMDSIEAAHRFGGKHKGSYDREGDVTTKFNGRSIDILFIDTIHTYDRTLAEFFAYEKLLNKGGAVVVLDDLHRHGMQEAWEDLPGEKIRLDDLHHGGSPTDGGFGVILM